MILTTRGIVLKAFRYNDSSVVAKMYTEELGLQSFLVNIGKGARSKSKASLLQPLSCVEIVLYHKNNHNLHRVKEINQDHVFVSLPFNTLKSSIALFLAEIVYRSIKEEEQNQQLFHFFYSQIKALDNAEEEGDINNFHLKFMILFSRYLGFYPGNEHFNSSVFDLSEGMFMHKNVLNEYRLEEDLSACFGSMLASLENEGNGSVSLSPTNRKKLLRALIDYYTFHLPGMGEMKSQDVLETVLND